MNIRQMIREKLSINTLNEKLMQNRELHHIVFDIIDTIPHITLYGYSLKPLDYAEDFKQTNRDYLYKTSASDSYENMAIDMRNDVVDCAELHLLLTEDKCSVSTLDVVKANTKREALSLKLDYVNPEVKAKIMNYDVNYYPNEDLGTQTSLFLTFNLYIPRLTNNVMILNNNHYFNKYYIQRAIKLTEKGKLVLKHHSYTSYFSLDEDTKTFKLEIFGKRYNPLVFANVDDMPTLYDKIKENIGDYPYMTEFSEYFNNTIIEADTIMNDIQNDTVTHEELAAEIYDKCNIVRPNDVFNAFLDYTKAQVFNISDDTISLHSTLKGELRIAIQKSLKLTGKMRRVNIYEYKSKISIDPRTICTVIKSRKHYEMDKSANEIDTFNFFTYISAMDGESNVTHLNRNFQRKQIGVIDPIGTTTSENVGLAGLLCFSIPDKYIKEKE